MADVVVTQSARDAAAMFCSSPALVEVILEGAYDHHPLVQAFVAAEQRGAERAAGMRVQVIPARRFIDRDGRTIYSAVREGTMEDLPPEEADCFLWHGFAIVDSHPNAGDHHAD